MATMVNDSNFADEVLQSDIPVLVDFYADWCGPCRAMAPIIDELVKEYEGKIKIAKLNIDESPETASKYNVMSIPTLILFKGAEILEQVVGGRSKDNLKEMIDKNI